jgi:hypothetical protein
MFLILFLFCCAVFADDGHYMMTPPKAPTPSSNGNYDIPLMTPLYLNASSEAYMINGTFCIRFKGLFDVTCSPGAVLIVDPSKGMALFDFTSSGGGKNLLTPTDSYFFDGAGYGTTGCGVVHGWSFQDQVDSYTSAVSTLGSTFHNARYQGLVSDVGSCGSCGADLAVTYITRRNIIVQFEFGEKYPLNIGLGPQCYRVDASVSYDESTLQKGGNYDSYFVVPPQCLTGTNFCSDVWPSGNVCFPSCPATTV